MLFNWYTIDACFLSSSWQINSNGAFAATCIGVMLMVVLLEALRRLGKEFDDHLLREFQARLELLTASATPGEQQSVTFRASPLQQLIRAVIHASTFGLAYLVMLLAMYGELPPFLRPEDLTSASGALPAPAGQQSQLFDT